MPGTVLNILYVFTYLMLIAKLRSHVLLCLHFIDEKTETYSESVI